MSKKRNFSVEASSVPANPIAEAGSIVESTQELAEAQNLLEQPEAYAEDFPVVEDQNDVQESDENSNDEPILTESNVVSEQEQNEESDETDESFHVSDANEAQKILESSYFNKRINKLNAKRFAAEDRVKELEEEVRRLREAPREEISYDFDDTKYVDPNTGQEVYKPSSKDFPNLADWVEARETFEKNRVIANKVHAAYKKQLNEVESIDKSYKQKIQETKSLYPDWDKVSADSTYDVDMLARKNPELIKNIMKSSNGPHLSYYLMKNKEVLRNFYQLENSEALVALGQLEGELKMALKPKTHSKAPAPISAKKEGSNGIASGGRNKDLSEMSLSSWRKLTKPRQLQGK